MKQNPTHVLVWLTCASCCNPITAREQLFHVSPQNFDNFAILADFAVKIVNKILHDFTPKMNCFQNFFKLLIKVEGFYRVSDAASSA